jgi:hypothetical protein
MQPHAPERQTMVDQAEQSSMRVDNGMEWYGAQLPVTQSNAPARQAIDERTEQ